MTTPFIYQNIFQLDSIPEAIFRLQTPDRETAIYSTTSGPVCMGQREWLHAQAEAGSYYAMLKFGEQLLASNRDEERQQGLHWILRAAEAGDPSAQMLIGELFLDGVHTPTRAREGAYWLRLAAKSGHRRSATSFALRLIHGEMIEQDREKGSKMLEALANEGWTSACALLAALSFEKGDSASADGLAWLRHGGGSDLDRSVKVGLFLYLDSQGAPTLLRRRRFNSCAGILFDHLMRRGATTAAGCLAHLLRRDEIAREHFPSLAELLSPTTGSGGSFMMMNRALYLAAGIELSADWRTADEVVARIDDIQTALSWWRSRALSGDAEGHLVLAWLLRHRLKVDPDGLGLEARVCLAQKAGWTIPDWFSSRTNN